MKLLLAAALALVLAYLTAVVFGRVVWRWIVGDGD